MRTQATKIRWFYLCLGTLGMLVAGIIYAWSILKGPLATEFGWDAAQLGFNYTLTMLFVGAGNLLAGVLYHKVPYRLLFLASAVMVFGAFFGSAMMSGKHIVQLYICYAGIGGIGIGLFVVLIMSAVGSWFPDRKGLSAGTMNMGFGFSSMLFGTLASVLFEIPGFGWRNTYIALAAIGGIILLLVALLIKVAPADAQLPAAKVSKNAVQEEILNVSTPQMFRRLGFWQYYIFSILVFSLGSALISFAADYFKSIGAATALAVALVSVISVSNGVGRLCFGVIFDKKGRRTAMQTAAFAAVIAAALLALSIPTGQIILAVLCISRILIRRNILTGQCGIPALWQSAFCVQLQHHADIFHGGVSYGHCRWQNSGGERLLFDGVLHLPSDLRSGTADLLLDEADVNTPVIIMYSLPIYSKFAFRRASE